VTRDRRFRLWIRPISHERSLATPREFPETGHLSKNLATAVLEDAAWRNRDSRLYA
jgi:hypothetical protein